MSSGARYELKRAMRVLQDAWKELGAVYFDFEERRWQGKLTEHQEEIFKKRLDHVMDETRKAKAEVVHWQAERDALDLAEKFVKPSKKTDNFFD